MTALLLRRRPFKLTEHRIRILAALLTAPGGIATRRQLEQITGCILIDHSIRDLCGIGYVTRTSKNRYQVTAAGRDAVL